MTNFEKYKAEMTLKDFIDMKFSFDTCTNCPADYICMGGGISCEKALAKWGEEEA